MFKFMFKIIDWGTQNDNDLTLQEMEKNKTFSDECPTSVVITDEAEKLTVGTMLLNKRKLSYLQENIRILLPLDEAPQYNVWEGSDLKLISLQSVENFYHTLYDGLVAFGVEKGIDFILITLTPDAYAATKSIGLWPYVLEFPASGNSDELFYGILPLRGFLCEEYRERRAKMDKILGGF